MLKTQIITLISNSKHLRLMVDKIASSKFNIYCSFKNSDEFETFNYRKNADNKNTILEEIRSSFLSNHGKINKVINQNSDIYTSKEIEEFFNCSVEER